MKKKLIALALTLALLLPLIPGSAVFAEGEVPAFYGTSLFLENNIAINFVVDAEAFADGGFSEPQVTFDFNGDSTVATAPTSCKDGYYYFTFRGITATQMGDVVTATLSAVKDGVRVYGDPVEESVVSYCANLLSLYSGDETLRTLVVDLLNYGAKSQLYFKYNTSSLANASLTPAQLAWGTSTDPSPVSIKDVAYETATDPEVTWYASNLKLADAVDLQFFFIAEDISFLRIDVKDGSGNVLASFSEDDFDELGDFRRVCLDTLTPDQMGEILYVTAYRDPGAIALPASELPFASLTAAPVSDTLRYSIESYAADAIPDKNDAKLTALLYAMLNYGAAARAYAEETRVPDPAAKPDYTFDHSPTTDEMRAMAVKAMRDELSVQWYTPVEIRFSKGGAAAGEYVYDAGHFYGGMPYTSAGIGLFQFLDYYNAYTGRLLYTDSENFNDTIGNTCGSSAVWALFSVCTSLRGLCTSKNLTKANGFFPLGDLDYDSEVTEFDATNSTQNILQSYGAQTVYQAYAQVKPGDLLVFSDGGDAAGHTMMAIADAVVITDASGNIDPQSYIKIQDQRPDLLEDPGETGVDISYFGRRSTKFYFSYLRSNGYLPMTTAEFLGTKAYEDAALSAKHADTDEAPAGTISTQYISSYYLESNFPMALAQFVVNAGTENERVIQTKYFSRTQVNSGAAFHWRMTDFANPVRNALRDAGYVKDGSVPVTVRVTVSNGAVFEPITFVYS